MFRKGFTLAEVLITLTVIGVVTALALPSLIGSFQSAKVGPTLSKFINTLSVANEHILEDMGAASYLTYDIDDVDEYFDYLENYVDGVGTSDTLSELDIAVTNYKGGSDDVPATTLQIYKLGKNSAFAMALKSSGDVTTYKSAAKGSYKGVIADIYFDMNGFDTKPNRLGKDIFYFKLDNNGHLLPSGGREENLAYPSIATTVAWESSTADRCNETYTDTGASCAGSVVDNNWKVIYKY